MILEAIWKSCWQRVTGEAVFHKGISKHIAGLEGYIVLKGILNIYCIYYETLKRKTIIWIWKAAVYKNKSDTPFLESTSLGSMRLQSSRWALAWGKHVNTCVPRAHCGDTVQTGDFLHSEQAEYLLRDISPLCHVIFFDILPLTATLLLSTLFLGIRVLYVSMAFVKPGIIRACHTKVEMREQNNLSTECVRKVSQWPIIT